MRCGTVGVFNHESPRLAEINIERMKHIKPGGNWTDIPLDLLPKGMKKARRSDHTKRYGRVTKDGLASTILTKCDPHWGAFIHYEQDRSFTVREAARIQSFPDHLFSRGMLPSNLPKWAMPFHRYWQRLWGFRYGIYWKQ